MASVPKSAGHSKSKSVRKSTSGEDLATRANLGPKSSQMLAAAGISSFLQLQHLGAVAAYLKVKSSGVGASLNLLWALEGAITGTHWKVVARERREALLLALDDQMRGTSRTRPVAGR